MIELDERSKLLRRMVVSSLEGGRRGHLGSSLSMIEMLRVLFDDIMHYRPSDPWMEDRDRLILSKGHGCLALYALLADKGFFAESELATFCRFESRLGGHPERGKLPGVESSTGALGHGLPIAVGTAVALRLKDLPSRVFVVVGDGELNEGSNWEAAMSASKHQLGNLIVMVDYNKLQSYGPLSEVIDLEPLAAKFESFGFNVREVDGHDVDALKGCLQGCRDSSLKSKPHVVICHTVKGKGVPFAEHNPKWHHKSNISDQELDEISKALA